MGKLPDETKSGSSRAEFIKVKSNVRLHITLAGKGWALAMFVLIFIVVSACNKTSELLGDTLRPASFTDKQWLGKQLFFDTNLSEPAGLACAGCHAS
ncbi:MAG TPA: cytochrome c peroxidase, partial [Bacteroidales bacterium]